jgi:hypothetical protein
LTNVHAWIFAGYLITKSCVVKIILCPQSQVNKLPPDILNFSSFGVSPQSQHIFRSLPPPPSSWLASSPISCVCLPERGNARTWAWNLISFYLPSLLVLAPLVHCHILVFALEFFTRIILIVCIGLILIVVGYGCVASWLALLLLAVEVSYRRIPKRALEEVSTTSKLTFAASRF